MTAITISLRRLRRSRRLLSCTVAVEAADCFTFSASSAQMVFEVRAETDRPIVWRTLVL